MIATTISRYRIVEKIGRGMAAMCKAVNADPGRFVALKFLPLGNYRRESKYDS
jgi:hypothetical protein